MVSNHSLENLKRYHAEAINFFAAELLLLKEGIPKIEDEKLAQTASLLLSAGQTGTALIQLANQIEDFANECLMLTRSIMEKLTNFCYLCICDEEEYRAFILHPVYKQYHKVGMPKMEDDINFLDENFRLKKEKQEKLKSVSIVQEALTIFSETKSGLNWTKKTLNQKIEAIENSKKVMDFFFVINKSEYYSDASEVLHGSLYGCTYDLGSFESGFDIRDMNEVNKKVYKNAACTLLHLGTLIHECLTMILQKVDLTPIWDYSYKNRGNALNLLYHILEKKAEPYKKER